MWLTGQGHIDAVTGKERLFSVTFQNVRMTASFMPEIEQTHMSFMREDLIMLRDAIDKEIER